MTKNEFAELYYTRTNDELAEMFGVHFQTVINKAKRLKLQPKGIGYKHKTRKTSSTTEKIITTD